MKTQLRTQCRLALLAFACIMLFLIHRPVAKAQNAEPFNFFHEYVGLDEGQISAIRNGKAVAKIIESRTPDEVFVFGSVYVQSTPEKYLKLASDVDALRKLPSYLAIQSSASLRSSPISMVSLWKRKTSSN